SPIDHDDQFRVRFLQEICKNAVERRNVFDRQSRDAIHTAAGEASFGAGNGSTDTAVGATAPVGAAAPCLLNLWSNICETALSEAKTFCPVLEMTSKLCTRFLRLFKTNSI